MPDIFISDPSTPPTPVEVPKTEEAKSAISGHTHNRFSSFCLYPESVDFDTKNKDEKIILMLRQHIIVNLKWFLATILLLIIPSIASGFGILSTLPIGFELVISLAWYLVTMAYALENFLDWYFNVYFVTNLRVVDVDFYNLIDKKVSDADLDKIQDVSYTNFGIFRMLFNYGDVFIQTASEVSEFDFLAVPDPDRVTKIIGELKLKHD